MEPPPSQGRFPFETLDFIYFKSKGNMWQSDGRGQTRIGVLTPHADVVPEAEFNALAPDGISIHAARVPFGGYKPGGTMDPTIADDPVRAFADPPAVDDAGEMLAMAPLHVSGFTSSCYVRGAADTRRYSPASKLARWAYRLSYRAQRRRPHFMHSRLDGSH